MLEVKVYQRVERPGARPKPMIRHVRGQREAERVEADLKRLRDQGVKLNRKTTVAQYAESWLDGKADEDVANQTMVNYRDTLKRYVLPTLGEYRLLAMTLCSGSSWSFTGFTPS